MHFKVIKKPAFYLNSIDVVKFNMLDLLMHFNEEVPNDEPLTYSELQEKAHNLVSSTEVTEEKVIESFESACKLESLFSKMPGYSSETVQLLYPDRVMSFFEPLNQFKDDLLPRMDFTKLHPEYVKDAMETLIEKHLSRGPGYHSGLMCTQDTGDPFFYVRSLTSYASSSEIDDKVFKLIRENNSQVARDQSAVPEVSDKLFGEMIDHEKKIFKIHLNLPPERRKEFFEKYFDKQKITREEIGEWRKKMESEGVSIPPEEARTKVIEAGLGFVNIEMMKFTGFNEKIFKHDLEGNLLPDFVFYLPTNLDMKATELMKNQVLEGLSDILSGIEEDIDDNLPRYSTPYIDGNGRVHSSLSVAQGDSDFKNYLKRVGKLDTYFDKSTNYALAKSS